VNAQASVRQADGVDLGARKLNAAAIHPILNFLDIGLDRR
jgi:hypothetical protein